MTSVVIDIRRNRVKKMIRKIKEHKYIYLILFPGLLHLIIFAYIPMYGVTLAFKEFNFANGILNSPWVGFHYFREAFSNPKFWQVFRNTVEISFGNFIFGFWVPILIAILLNELRGKFFKRTVQTVIYLPHFISWIVIYGILYSFLSVDGGVVNKIITGFGGTPMNFLTNENAFRPIVYISNIWKEAGWGTILYLAALAGINPELLESAEVDGANRLQKIMHITIPCISGTIIVLMILAIANFMNAGFDQIFNLKNSAVNKVADILDTYVYELALVNGNFSFGATVGLFKSVINFSLLVFVNWLSRRFTGSGIY